MLPVETNSSFQGSFCKRKLSTKSESFVIDYDPLLCNGNGVYLRVRCSVAIRKIKRVDGVVASLGEAQNQPPRKLRVDEKLHATADSIRLICVIRVANAKAARMSSRSRSS